MTKKLLIIIAVIMLPVAICVSFAALKDIIMFLAINQRWIPLIALAIVIQLTGHLFRAKRTKLLTDQAALSSVKFQFMTLSIGYLFNAILPLRLGELIRALLIAKRLRISFLYTFVAIVIERIIDIIFLGVIIINLALFIGGQLALGLVFVSIFAVLVAICILVILLLLQQENKSILLMISSLSRVFNVNISNSIRFKVWSLIFGLQNFFGNKKFVRRYIVYAAISWLCYFTSTLIIVFTLLSITNLLSIMVAGISPYAISAPLISLPDANLYHKLTVLLPSQLTGVNVGIYSEIIWAVLVIPMAAIGIVGLLIYKNGRARSKKASDPISFANKLLRYEDISQEFPGFLDSYFSGNKLARILHKLEIAGDLRLVKFFKGGSDAVTILVLNKDKLFVKKVIPKEYEDRLKAQYDWLLRHKQLKYLVGVIGEQVTDEYYAIDLEYDPENIPFFEYIHHDSLSNAKKVVNKVWVALYDDLYKNASSPRKDTGALEKYIEKHVYGCIEKACAVDADLAKAVLLPKITINGKEYDNLRQIMKKIKNNKKAWSDLATYSHSDEVHGDMAIDNILVSARNGQPLIIDPAPDGNVINGPVFDFGKLSQSFYCGYEFLFRDNEPVNLEEVSIRYRENISNRYVRLWKYIKNELAPKYLSESEQRAMIFHAAVLHIRVLKHRVYINPGNALKFYAVGVKTLNEFLEQYENKS